MALTPLIGNETLYVIGVNQAGGLAPIPEQTTTQAVANLQVNGASAMLTTVSGNTPLTLTAASMIGAPDVTIILSAALAGAGAVTLPTVASMAALITNPSASTAYNLRIINTSSGNFAWTVTTNTGWTLNGTMTIAQNTFRDFVVDFSSASAAALTTVGTGTYS